MNVLVELSLLSQPQEATLEIEHSHSEQLSLTATTTQKNQNIKSSCFCCFTCIYSSDRASRWGYSVV